MIGVIGRMNLKTWIQIDSEFRSNENMISNKFNVDPEWVANQRYSSGYLLILAGFSAKGKRWPSVCTETFKNDENSADGLEKWGI